MSILSRQFIDAILKYDKGKVISYVWRGHHDPFSHFRLVIEDGRLDIHLKSYFFARLKPRVPLLSEEDFQIEEFWAVLVEKLQQEYFAKYLWHTYPTYIADAIATACQTEELKEILLK